jgi:hypothetical protein
MKKETLRQKQSRFAHMVALLILHAEQMGYELTFGDAYRDKRCNYGIKNSLHKQRLAVDFNLFKNGRYLRSTEAHRPLGEYWESIGGTWGGRFGDGNHYSLEHNGVK